MRLKQAIFNRLRGIKGYKEQKVLNGINLEIKKGDFILDIIDAKILGFSIMMDLNSGSCMQGIIVIVFHLLSVKDSNIH